MKDDPCRIEEQAIPYFLASFDIAN